MWSVRRVFRHGDHVFSVEAFDNRHGHAELDGSVSKILPLPL